ncbi:ATP-binding cassette domain-containing protein [Micrococcales bacterium 31B]|nr:ATP-binding cassette domain-containing protein [Micrococcales bacterium 31B]
MTLTSLQVDAAHTGVGGDLVIAGLHKTFGSTRALNNMTFTVGAGQMFGFVGSNGAGKTTTMRIALGVLAADSGTVTWGGRPIDDAARSRIGYMPEERGLYPSMKVGEQLVYLARLHGLSATLAKQRMEEWTERLGIAERRGDTVQKLSLGNQQRVQLAAALVHDPDLLVLDEPFSGLDPVAVDVMSDVLRERTQCGVAVLFSSHQLELVERLCDRVCIVRGGETIAVGSTEELRRGTTELWRVTVQGPETPWLGATKVVVHDSRHTAQGTQHTVELQGISSQDLLHAAMAAGTVTQFGLYLPPLTELYRNVVSQTITEGSAA